MYVSFRVKRDSEMIRPTPMSRPSPYHLEGTLFRGVELEALVDEDVEVSLAHVRGDLGPEFGRNDWPLHSRALRGRRLKWKQITANQEMLRAIRESDSSAR